MKHRFSAFISLVLVLVFILSACSQGAPVDTSEPEKPTDSQTETSETSSEIKEPVSEADNTTEEAVEVDYIVNDVYGANLIDEIYQENNGNVVVSPLSINFAMAMMLEGAEGETKTEIERFLGVKKENLDEYVGQLLKSAIDKENAQTVISNAFWYMAGSSVGSEYAETLKNRYFAEISDMDFRNPENAAKIINAWCDEHTKGLIPQIVEADDVADAEDVVVNTVYFKCTWLEEIKDIAEGEFAGFDNTYNVEYLTSYEDIYMENDYAIAFSKPYSEKYSFIGVLPKAEGEFNVADLDIASLLEKKTTEFNVKTVMPKLNIEGGGKINEVLKKMGIIKAFSDTAEFDEITNNIHISDVIHKTNIILDETGTEAAAATAIITRKNAAVQVAQVKEVILDRPYAFFIIDNETGSILFSGKIVNFQ